MIVDENSTVPSPTPEAAAPPGRIRWPKIVVVIVVIVAAIAAGKATLKSSPAAGAGRGRPIRVGTAVVDKGELPVNLSALGTVTPEYSVTLKTQIAGYLTQVNYREGQLVHAGDFLAQIDPRPYRIAEAQALGQLRKDQALLKAAKIDLGRYRTLLEQDSVAGQQVDTQEALVQQYQGVVESDQAQVDTSRLNLTYCHIVAPISGRVGLRLVDPGNYVQPTDTNGLVVITQLQPITVIFTLAEDSLEAVMRRLHAHANLTVVLSNRNDTAELARGHLTTVDNQIDTTTGTVKLRAQFANDDDTLFPNQFVNVRLLVDQLRDATVAPSAAVRSGAPGTFVYLVKSDNTVAVRPVKLGPSAGERVAIESGLQVGDRVVVDGIDKLRDGASVTFAAPKAAVSAAR